LRFSVNTPGEVFVLNKQDGVLRMLVPLTTPGDFDADGDVDGRDFLAWQRNPSVGDLADWQNNYGVGELASGAAIPEPASLALLISSALFALKRRSVPRVARHSMS
jgi:hypothetical protein